MNDTDQQPEIAPKTPPHSAETEAAVLSAWSLHDRFGSAWKPEPELFYVAKHRLIAQAMAKMDPNVRDEASLFAQLDADATLNAVGGTGVVHAIVMGAPIYGDPWPHVGRLREAHALREVLKLVDVAAAEAYEHKNLGAMIAKLQEAIAAGTSDMTARVLSVSDLLRAVAEGMMQQRDVERCRTGLPSLDKHIGGFQHKQVSVFGAGTSWGKSSYSVLVSDLAFEDGKRPLLVSFEDPEELYGRRLAARRANVSPNRLRNGKYGPSNEEWSRVLGVAERAEKTPFFINAVGKTAERVATDIRCVCASEAIDIVLIDYLQAVNCSKRHQDRRNEVTYIARLFTDVIKSSGAAGLMFSQFKRPMKPGEKPTKHSLKESGDLENAAENVLIGFLDSEGRRIIRTEKAKDGQAFKEYEIGWSDVTCGFTGELAVYDDPEPLDETDQRYP